MKITSSSTTTSLKNGGSSLLRRMALLIGMVILFWVLELTDWILPADFDQLYGIRPRTIDGLKGIILAPFLHANWAHLISNTIPFLLLGGLVMLQGTQRWLWVTVFSAVVGGVGTWLIGGANTTHIGASILIFGYAGYLMVNAWFERSWQAILLSVLTIIFYGGLILGLNPFQDKVSWQGHLFGFIGGILASRFLAKK